MELDCGGSFSQMRPNLVTDPHQQLALILEAPWHFLAVLHLEFVNHGVAHLRELIGFSAGEIFRFRGH